MARRRETAEEIAARDRVDWSEVEKCVRENEMKLQREAVAEAERFAPPVKAKRRARPSRSINPDAIWHNGKRYEPAPMPKDEEINAALALIRRNRLTTREP